MRTLVTGGSGFVGWQLVQSLAEDGHAVGFTYHSTEPTVSGLKTARFPVDIRNPDRVNAVVAEFNPDIVIHAAALTDADECERNPKRAQALNVAGTRHVVEACECVGASVAFLSSSFVFDGGDGPYVESDETNPINIYGETKVAAERIVKDAAGNSLICRIDQPYYWLTPWQEHTFVEWVLDQCNRGDPFDVFEDWYNTPVYVPDAVNVLQTLLSKDAAGVYHVVGDEYVNRYEWARTAAAVFGYDPCLVRPGDSDDAELPARRPNANLSNRKVRNDTRYGFHSIEEGLAVMRDATE